MCKRKNLLAAVLAGVLVAGPVTVRADQPSLADVCRRAAEVMEAAAAAGTMDLNGLQAAFTFDLELDGAVYQAVRLPFSGIFNRDFAPRLTGAGSFRVDFGPADDENGAGRRMLLELSSNQLSFLFLRDGEDLAIFSPQFNALVKDDFARLARTFEENRSAVPGLSAVQLPEVGGRERDVTVHLERLAAAIRLLGTTLPADRRPEKVSFHESDCYLLTFPGERGERNRLAVYADSATPAWLETVDAAGTMTTRLEFPAPRPGPVAIRHYLPAAVSVEGTRDGNRIALRFDRLRYNPFLGEEDFRLREVNLAEFLGMVYLRAASGGF